MAENFLRTLVKTDTRTALEISELTGLHRNTITALTRPALMPIDHRLNDSISRLARFYGYEVKIRLDFIPINGDENA